VGSSWSGSGVPNPVDPSNEHQSLMQLLKECVHHPFGVASATMTLDMTRRLGV